MLKTCHEEICGAKGEEEHELPWHERSGEVHDRSQNEDGTLSRDLPQMLPAVSWDSEAL